jgi:4-amino-4-deoxy-L-arabinose transferase-like glycosyltransferase
MSPRWGLPNGEAGIAMNQWCNLSIRRSLPVGLFCLALLARVGFVLTLEERLYWPDEHDFVEIARGLADGQGYQGTPIRANPVLSYFLAAIYQLVGYGHLVPRLIQCVIGALVVCIVFALAQRLFHTGVAVLAALSAALYPPLIYICGVFYVECLFTTLLALSVYLLYVSAQARGVRFVLLVVAAGVVIGITVLCRPIFLIFLPFAAFFLVCADRGSFLRKTASAMVLVMVASLTVLPWTLRNYALYNRLLLVATGSGLFLWRGNNELAKGDTHDRYLDPGTGDVWLARLQELPPAPQNALLRKYHDVERHLEALDQIDQDKYLQRIALAFMREHPAQSFGLFLHKVRTLYTAFTEVRPEHRELIRSKQQLAMLVIFYPTLGLAILGMVYGLRQWRRYLILYLPILSLTMAYGILTSASRFRIPFEPYVLIFTSYGTFLLLDLLRLSSHPMRQQLSHYQPLRAPK